MHLPFAKDCLKYFISLVLLTLLTLIFGWYYLGILFGIGSIFILYFFRDPERKTPNIEGSIVAAADGKVVEIEQVKNPQFPQGEAIRISIFLSIFNVHINRSPIAGKIINLKYIPGKFFNALQKRAAFENEHSEISFSDGNILVIVKQIAGVIARRVVCICKEGDFVNKGERIGLIRFGSRVDIILPVFTDIRVKLGTKVIGGKTVLGIIANKKGW